MMSKYEQTNEKHNHWKIFKGKVCISVGYG